MSSEPLWERFANYENFLLAWQRTVNVTSRMVNDELGLETFAYNLQANLEDLVRQVRAEDFPYCPLADHKVYIPKASSTLRTMSLMTISDVIVYQALSNVIADAAHPQMVSHETHHVLGNIYAGKHSVYMLRPWKDQYNRFVERIESIFKKGNRWMASTDIVSFYDTIDHERLLHLVKKYCGKDEKFEVLLRNCLSTWATHNRSITMSRGIPQGSNASDFLANLYLYESDQFMIANGYHYVRYVDDIRILGLSRSTVQKGLIDFDLELKQTGLVAQVTKTSIHEVQDIDKEIFRLRFFITDPTGQGNYILASMPSSPKTEQAASVGNQNAKLLQGEKLKIIAGDAQGLNNAYLSNGSTMIRRLNSYDEIPELQTQLRMKFFEALKLLNDTEKAREAESSLTFCLFRLEPHDSIRQSVIDLMPRLPWRSEAITSCLSKFKHDDVVVQALTNFLEQPQVYSWHKANALRALHHVSSPDAVAEICRKWLIDLELDWYSKTVAARILSKVAGQSPFLMERLRKLSYEAIDQPEETAILRRELAHSAFSYIRSREKQLALLRLIAEDRSPTVRKLLIYLLQQDKCRIGWDEVVLNNAQSLTNLSELVIELGLSKDAPRQCFIATTFQSMYEVELMVDELKVFYRTHYDESVKRLRLSVAQQYRSPDEYVRMIHQFAHLSLIAFYEYVLPNEGGVYDGYANLTDRKAFSELVPNNLNTWKRFG